MKANLTFKQICVFALILPLWSVSAQDFQPEPIGQIGTLPAEYPSHWVLVHDFSFEHMSEGEIQVIDPLAEGQWAPLKGMLTASFISSYQRSAARNEHYVIESFFSRGGRGGERTDVVTIWDTDTLQVAGEIIIPAKRLTGMPKTLATGFIGGDRLLGVYNFTPAQSVSIIDLDKREFVGEVATSGCAFVIPNGEHSFTSICADGAFLTTTLDDAGNAVASVRSAPMFDANSDPIFEGAAMHAGIAYFPTFQGQILPINVQDEQIQVAPTWWLTQPKERNWRPGGIKPFMVDADGFGYFLMNPQGGEGTHKDPGTQVWRYDLAAGKRLDRLPLNTMGLSIGATGEGDNMLMLVTNIEMKIDVYRIPSGKYVRTLDTGTATPFLVYGAN